MQRGYDNLEIAALRGRWIQQLSRVLCAYVLVSFLSIQSLNAETISPEGLMGMPEVAGAVVAISNLNNAMREAAENPMDKWRRQNVRHYMSLLPPAIVGVAQVFMAGKLHNKDLPTVQSMLGGFVDVNAADNYKKFLQAPSANLIPKLGENFPEQYGPQGGASAGSPKVIPPSHGLDKVLSQSVQKGVSEPQTNYKKDAAKSQDELADKVDSIALGFDDSNKKQGHEHTHNNESVASQIPGLDSSGSGLGTPDSPAELASNSSSTNATSSQQEGGSEAGLVGPVQLSDESLVRNLASGASLLAGKTIIKKDSSEEEGALSTDFFGKKKRKGERAKKDDEESLEDQPIEFDKNGKMVRRKSKSGSKPSMEEKILGVKKSASVDPTLYKSSIKPKYWSTSPIVMVAELFLIKDALAECQGGNCQEEGGGGGGGGEAAGQILMGVAAIISAISPMVVAGIEASKEKAIAETNARTQIELTNITANTSKFLSNQQKEIALTQTAVAQQISKENNEGVTGRLELQLAELRSAREDAAARERERRAIEQELNAERIALAEKQADDNLRLAQQTLNAQLTQAGLTGGFSNSRNSGDQLSVGRVVTTRPSTSSLQTGGGNVTGNGIPTSGLAFTNQQPGQAATSVANANSGALRGITNVQLANEKNGEKKEGQAGNVTTTSASRARLFTNLSVGSTKVIDGDEYVLDENGEWVLKDPKKRKKSSRGLLAVLNSSSLGAATASLSSGGRGATSSGRLVANVDRQLSGVLTSSDHNLVRGSTNQDRVRITSAGSGKAVKGSTSGGDLSDFIQATAQQKETEESSFARFREQEDKPSTASVSAGGHRSSGRGARSGYSTAIGR